MWPADWQLPPGVTRGVWDYAHDAGLARGYDASLEGSALRQADMRFAEQHLGPPGWLLDLGCGTGRLLVAFARRGFRTLGVDLSEEMLRIAGEKAAAAGVTVHRLQANIVQLEGLRDGTFDCAACLFSTLGMVAGAGERRRAIGHVYRLLRPGGRFVLHVHNRWFSFWGPPGRRWLARDLVKSALGKADAGDRAMPIHQGIAGLSLHLFTRREAVQMLREARFRILEVSPASLSPHSQPARVRLFGWLRAYGYLIAAERAQ
jgi:SAM-dependent methyltransferase